MSWDFPESHPRIIPFRDDIELLVADGHMHRHRAGGRTESSRQFEETGIRYIQGSVETIKTEHDELDYIDADVSRQTLSYDRLILAAGSKLFRPDIPGLLEHAFSVDQLDEAAALEVHLQSLASQPSSLKRNTVVVAGGGFTGIEIATELPTRLKGILGTDTEVKIIIVERSDAIGPDLGSGPRQRSQGVRDDDPSARRGDVRLRQVRLRFIHRGDTSVAAFVFAGINGQHDVTRLAEQWTVRDGRLTSLRVFYFDPHLVIDAEKRQTLGRVHANA
jgi:NADPH-dependent 2,4-dienoyl-CoA reductase/sulfur reductase-like enzyme